MSLYEETLGVRSRDCAGNKVIFQSLLAYYFNDLVYLVAIT